MTFEIWRNKKSTPQKIEKWITQHLILFSHISIPNRFDFQMLRRMRQIYKIKQNKNKNKSFNKCIFDFIYSLVVILQKTFSIFVPN